MLSQSNNLESIQNILKIVYRYTSNAKTTASQADTNLSLSEQRCAI